MSFIRQTTFIRNIKELDMLLKTRKLVKGHFAVLSPFALRSIYSNPEIKEKYIKVDRSLADGFYVHKFATVFNDRNIKMIPGPDLFLHLLKEKSLSIFLIGTTDDILLGIKEYVKQEIGDRQIDYFALPFKEDIREFDYIEISIKVKEVNPDIIFVGLGAPKQDLFIQELLKYIDKGVCMGVGAAFEFYSNNHKVKRAPKWVRKMKCEWVYRLIKQRKKMIPRVVGNIIYTPVLIYKEVFQS